MLADAYYIYGVVSDYVGFERSSCAPMDTERMKQNRTGGLARWTGLFRQMEVKTELARRRRVTAGVVAERTWD
jgi:hypothetical protein